MKMWKVIQEVNPIWNFDATGSVIKNFRRQKMPLLYSLVSHDNVLKQILPIAEFITTSHTIDSISANLSIIKDKLDTKEIF